MVFKTEFPQRFQVGADAVREQSFGGDDEVPAQLWTAVVDVPVGRGELLLVQLWEERPVVVEHWGHTAQFHRIIIEEEPEVAVVPVRVQRQGIQHAHPAKSIITAVSFEELQKLWDCLLALEHRAGLGKPCLLVGEQGAFAYELVVVVRQIIIHIAGTDSPGQL